MENKKIIVLGGGYGGVLTAKKLAKKFKKNKNVQITLIDKNPYHTMLTELHEVVANRVSEDSIKMDFEKIFAGRNVDFVMDQVTNIDFNEKKLKSENTEYAYDYLVIGTGCRPTFFGIKGAQEYAHRLWSYDDAISLREHVLAMFRQASKETNENIRRELLTFAVLGGGFTGIEMAGELAEYKPELCNTFGIDPKEVSIIVYDKLPSILNMYPKKLIKKSERYLRKIGVDIVTGVGLTEVTPNFIGLDNGETTQTRTLIWAAGIEGSELMGTIDVEKNGRGRIVTNGHLQAKDYKDVYVVGDNIFYIPEGEERPVPQMVENAEHSAGCVAHNIKVDIKGGSYETYKPTFHGSMVCIGGRYGVAHVGFPKMMFSLTGFFAMLSKHFINIIYFLQVLGFTKVYSYLKHEVFHVRKRRSFVGGHFANAQLAIFTLPLRLFLGYMWLSEGLKKMPDIVKDFSNVFLFPANPLDATSGATGAGEAAAETMKALWRPDFLENIMDWSMKTFFWNPEGGFTLLAEIVQAVMVTGEIVVGGLLLLGLFTPVAAIISFIMCTMIYTSGMASKEILWYAFAAVAVPFSGNTFGLDYYVWPWINEKILKRWKFTRKWYFYID